MARDYFHIFYREPSQAEKIRTLGQHLETNVEKVNRPPEQWWEEERTRVTGRTVSLTDLVMRWVSQNSLILNFRLWCAAPRLIKSPSAPIGGQKELGFEAEVWGGNFVTFGVKNHSEKSYHLSELCLEVWVVTTPGKGAIPDKS